jgi:hypothetical protein
MSSRFDEGIIVLPEHSIHYIIDTLQPCRTTNLILLSLLKAALTELLRVGRRASAELLSNKLGGVIYLYIDV